MTIMQFLARKQRLPYRAAQNERTILRWHALLSRYQIKMQCTLDVELERVGDLALLARPQSRLPISVKRINAVGLSDRLSNYYDAITNE